MRTSLLVFVAGAVVLAGCGTTRISSSVRVNGIADFESNSGTIGTTNPGKQWQMFTSGALNLISMKSDLIYQESLRAVGAEIAAAAITEDQAYDGHIYVVSDILDELRAIDSHLKNFRIKTAFRCERRDKRMCAYVIAHITNALHQEGATILDRRNLSKIRAEQIFQLSDEVDSNSTIHPGKIYGATHLLLLNLISTDSNKYSFWGTINARIVSITTGAVVASSNRLFTFKRQR